jgi:Protein of unknown function (DUF4238)
MMRHHYVPQFYLKRFANQKRELRAFRRTTHELSKVTVRRAASEIGFYDVEGADGVPHDLIEKLLGERMENFAAMAFQRLEKSWPPSDEDRDLLAVFMAVQLVRTPEHRFVWDEIADIGAKLQLRGVQLGSDRPDERTPDLSDIDLGKIQITTNPGYMWAMLLDMAVNQMAPMLAYDFVWHLFESHKRVLATSDRPVLYWVHKPSPLRGVGLATADEVYMPVDSRRLLGLSREPDLPSSSFPLARMHARQMNRHLLAHSYEWVYHDPRVKLFTPSDLDIKPRPAFMINSQEIYEPGDSWQYISEWIKRTDE